MAALGMIGTGQFSADDWPKNWRTSILYLYPNGGAPLTALLTALIVEGTDSPEYNWNEKDLPPDTLYVDGAFAAGAVSIKVDNNSSPLVNTADYVRAGILLRNWRTGEIMRVSQDPTPGGTNITVIRGYGSTAAANINDNDKLRIIGNAQPEGGDVPTPRFNAGSWKTNYTQIFRTPLSATRTAIQTSLRTEAQWIRAKIEANQMHFMEMEMAFFYGELFKTTDIDTGQPIRTTMGVRSFIKTYAPNNIQTVAGGNLDLDAWEEHLRKIFLKGSSEKIAFVGSKALSVVNRLAMNHGEIKLVPKETTYGIQLMEYVTPYGVVYLKMHPLFNRDEDTQKQMVFIDTSNIMERDFKSTAYIPNRQGNGVDGRLDEYMTENGLELHHAETHYWLENVNAAA